MLHLLRSWKKQVNSTKTHADKESTYHIAFFILREFFSFEQGAFHP